MGIVKELLRKLMLGKKTILNDRIEFRLNSKEKEIIQKYCDLQRTDVSKFLRRVAMQEIDEFLNYNKNNQGYNV